MEEIESLLLDDLQWDTRNKKQKNYQKKSLEMIDSIDSALFDLKLNENI